MPKLLFSILVPGFLGVNTRQPRLRFPFLCRFDRRQRPSRRCRLYNQADHSVALVLGPDTEKTDVPDALYMPLYIFWGDLLLCAQLCLPMAVQWIIGRVEVQDDFLAPILMG